MAPAETVSKSQFPWAKIAWFGALMIACYAPILRLLVWQWDNDADMSHGYFVPLVSGFVVWQRRDELMALKPRPNWWGLAVVVLGGLMLILATLGAELFIARISFVITLIGAVWLLGGTLIVRNLMFPLLLLFLMIPIPAVIYNQFTFQLQLLASRFADTALTAFSIPVLREGNILELPTQRLDVVEACSGIRSLITLTFLSLVYGYFFEKRKFVRLLLFLSTIPVAIVANGLRITITGVLTQDHPELAEGFFHAATGLFLAMGAFSIMVIFHLLIVRFIKFKELRAGHA
jgi:exosortase